jgi:hypothetical protein
LYESDMVMLDYQTGSYWWQVAGRAIVGPLTNEGLTVLPSVMTTWKTWQELHPETLVLSRETGFNRDYSRDPFGSLIQSLNRGQFPFPVSEAGRDNRLQPGEKVLVIKVGNDVKAYPLQRLESMAIMDEVGEFPIVIFTDPDRLGGAAYGRRVEGQVLSFILENGRYIDLETRSIWELSGNASAGPLAGVQLTPIASKTAFWYSIVAAEPEITVYKDE